MNRRSFIVSWAHRADSPADRSPKLPRTLSSGLEPYTPSASQPWNAVRVGHLLRRTTFMPRWQDIATLMAQTPSDAVDTLLNTPSTPVPPTCANNMTESLDGLDIQYRNIITGQWESDGGTLRAWLAGVLTGSGLSIVEKMTFFWSSHFCSQFITDDMSYVVAPLLYRQNKLYRESCLGDFREFVKNVTLDSGMLVYLGGDLNVVGKPNENYGRELMELFTLGLGQYTEGDIKEAARILTGWRASQYNDKPAPNGNFNPYFVPNGHDMNAKQFMGISFAARDSLSNTEYLVRKEEVFKLVDTIFDQRTDAVAKFICRKIYRYFVYSSPTGVDETIVTALAEVFKTNNFQIKSVMSALLKSAHFFDNLNMGAQIKTPAEYEVGMSRQIGNAGDVSGNSGRLGQTFFNPPNVSGWTGWHDWITSTTYPRRSDYAATAVAAMDDATAMAFIKQFPGYDKVGNVVDSATALLLPRKLSAGRKAALQAKLLANAPDYEWTNIMNSPSTAARNLRDMLTAIVQLPDFQLC